MHGDAEILKKKRGPRDACPRDGVGDFAESDVRGHERRRELRRPERHHDLARAYSKPEDGIRDSEVTGVQTCALPISTLFFFQAEDGIRDSEVTGVQTLLFR